MELRADSAGRCWQQGSIVPIETPAAPSERRRHGAGPVESAQRGDRGAKSQAKQFRPRPAGPARSPGPCLGRLKLLRSSLDSGKYLVVAPPAMIGNLPARTSTVTFALDKYNIQNGSLDGIALVDTNNSFVIDALSNEGSIVSGIIFGPANTVNLVEGTATTVADLNDQDGSLVRCSNGQDTDNAIADWHFAVTPTPGAANDCP